MLWTLVQFSACQPQLTVQQLVIIDCFCAPYCMTPCPVTYCATRNHAAQSQNFAEIQVMVWLSAEAAALFQFNSAVECISVLFWVVLCVLMQWQYDMKSSIAMLCYY